MNKKIWMVLAAMLLGIVSASADDVKKNIQLNSSPQQITVSHAIDVEVIPSDRNMMVVKASPKALEQFKHSYTGGKLVLRREGKLFRRITTGDIEVKLYVTDVTKVTTINASGASEVELESNQPLGLRSIDASGASKIKLEGQLQSLSVDISGASKLDFEGSAKSIALDVSGASKVDLDATTIAELSADISGASRVDLEGKIGRLTADVSGASKLEGDDATIEVASLEASGASSIRVNAQKVIKSSATGGSSIR